MILPLPATAQAAEMVNILLGQGKGDLDPSAQALLAGQLGEVEIGI